MEDRFAGETREERRARKARERARMKKILLIISIIVVILAALIIVVLVVFLKGHMEAETNAIVGAEDVNSFSITYVGEKTDFAAMEAAEQEAREAAEAAAAASAGLPTISTDRIASTVVYMVRAEDDAVLVDLASTYQMYPASMAKIMTALVAIEHISDMNSTYMFTGEEIQLAFDQDATLAGFDAWEEVPVRDIIYGILLPSGSDACYAIANYVVQGGSIQASESGFVDMMNQKAQELGMTDTHFTNCTGLHDNDQYSSCVDLVKLLKAAWANDYFREVFTSHSFRTTSTNAHPDGIFMTNTTFDYLEDPVLENGCEILGGKTGYTDEAGRCLASIARAADGTEYMLVTGGAFSNTDPYPNATDAKTLYGQLPG